MDLLKTALEAAIAAKRAEQAHLPGLTDAERVQAIIAALGRKDERAGQIRHILNIGPGGEIKPRRPPFDLAAFKAAEAARERAKPSTKVTMAEPTAADYATDETNHDHGKSLFRKAQAAMERWWEGKPAPVMGAPEPEPEPDPRIEAARRRKMNRDAEAWGERIRWQRDKPTWGSWMG